MKKMTLLLCFFCMAWCGFAQKYTEIKGFTKSDKQKNINLYRTVDGDMQLCATTDVAPDGAYGFSFCPETPGFYSLGEEKGVKYTIYVKGGERINLDIDETQARLKGKNTKENIALYQWEDHSYRIRLKSVWFMISGRVLGNSTYEDFFPELEKVVAGLDDFQAGLKKVSSEFDALLREKIRYDLDYYAIMLLQTPRTKHPQRSEWIKYYDSIVSADKYTTDVVMQFPMGARMLQSYVQFAHRQEGKEYTNESYEATALKVLQDNRLRGEFLLDVFMKRYKMYDQYLSGMKKYAPYLVTPSQQKRAEEIGAKLYESKEGGVAAGFTYPDVTGKQVSLSDFKGKVVLIDVWATWCGPCRSEIPHLKKLEEEMHGKEIVFIGVSLDEAKDKQKWLDFVKKEDMKGIQLHAGGWSKIAQDYKIKGIPRFIVVDKKGNIVTSDAPRPSSSDLKKLLESELQK